jgi:glutamate racemase
MQRYASGITLLEDPCIGLVEQIEAGELNTPATRQLLEAILMPMIRQQADTFVLGCTHYPFVAPLLQDIIGPNRTIINPAPAVARQLQRVLNEHHLLAPAAAETRHQLFFSGPLQGTTVLARHMIGADFSVERLSI